MRKAGLSEEAISNHDCQYGGERKGYRYGRYSIPGAGKIGGDSESCNSDYAADRHCPFLAGRVSVCPIHSVLVVAFIDDIRLVEDCFRQLKNLVGIQGFPSRRRNIMDVDLLVELDGAFVSGVGGGDGISSFTTSMAVPSSVLAGTSSGSSLEGSGEFSFAIIPKNIKHATHASLCQLSLVRRCWSCFQYTLRFIAVDRYMHIGKLFFDCPLVFPEPKNDFRPIVRRYAWGHVYNHPPTATLKRGLGRHIDRTI